MNKIQNSFLLILLSIAIFTVIPMWGGVWFARQEAKKRCNAIAKGINAKVIYSGWRANGNECLLKLSDGRLIKAEELI